MRMRGTSELFSARRRSCPLEHLLVRNNVMGLSNTAYRSDLLRRCLPIPTEAELMDWLLAVRSLALGARLQFDPEPRMWYRQYSN